MATDDPNTEIDLRSARSVEVTIATNMEDGTTRLWLRIDDEMRLQIDRIKKFDLADQRPGRT